MTYEEAVAYIQGLQRFGIKLGNERFEALLDAVGNPHLRLRVAHVAGTKGKGSTTCMIAAILTAHGFRTGGYYSPYVYDLRERVQIDGEMIPRDDFARHVAHLSPHADAIAEGALGATTEFELKTAVGFLHFLESATDYAAIEVGMGGRLDATNVVSPLACVITNIGLDHTQILGDTHAKIAAEKAGIVKPGVPIATATDEPSALETIRQVAESRGAPLTLVHPASEATGPCDAPVSWEPRDDGLCVRTPRAEYPGLHPRMGGAFQWPNAACAIWACETLAERGGWAVDADAVRHGLAVAHQPGRLDVVRRSPTVVLDGAHNGMAAHALAAEVARFERRRLIAVIGMLDGHAPEDVVAEIAPLADVVIATQPTWRRGLPAEQVADVARRFCSEVSIVRPPLAAAQAALAEAGPEDLVLVTGSFYTVGDVPRETFL